MTTTARPSINDSFVLPCGSRVSNRLVKCAMTEGLSDAQNHATEAHQTLYEKWSAGGAGLVLTGNIQVDRRYMERPGNIAIDGPQTGEALSQLKATVAAGTKYGNHFWAQLGHAGRQTPAIISAETVGPSDIASGLSDYFGKPRALRSAEIVEIINRFVVAAKVVRECGFTGLQIHAAHGYLFNQFLSPDVNNRTDEWGGCLENRARLLLETVREVRGAVGDDFPISVKLNCADFHQGGFEKDEAIQVATWLKDLRTDLIEVSGGTAEEPSMFLANRDHVNEEKAVAIKESAIAREAYFLEYAREIRDATSVPLMVTGGFRTKSGMNAALESNATDFIGVGRPLSVNPNLLNQLLDEEIDQLPAWELELRLKDGEIDPGTPPEMVAYINKLGPGLWFQNQVMRMGLGDPDPSMGLLEGMTALQENDAKAASELDR